MMIKDGSSIYLPGIYSTPDVAPGIATLLMEKVRFTQTGYFSRKPYITREAVHDSKLCG